MAVVPHAPDPIKGAIIDALAGGLALIYRADDAEPMRAEIIRHAVDQVADWVAYIRGFGTTVTRMQDATPYPDSASNWTIDSDGNWTAAATGAVLYQPLRLITGATLSEVQVFIDPANAARSGAYPQVLPSIRLLQIGTNGSVTVLGTKTDTPVSVNGYESPHPIVIDSLAHLVSADADAYRVEISTEEGANSFTGTSYIAARPVYTIGGVDHS
jgi:hypothetical protein